MQKINNLTLQISKRNLGKILKKDKKNSCKKKNLIVVLCEKMFWLRGKTYM